MKKHNPILFLFLALALFPALALYSQSPQGIPYQAVMRNADGSVMASSAVSLTFMIHDGTADGTVVYQESHLLTSNAQGLVSCVVGNGVVSQGNFGNINWGNGAKFLHVMMGSVDMGTQQMLSVPYALYAGSTHVSVSPTGDALTVGGQSVIVPGISAANPTNNIPTSGLGSQVLPGNTTCASEYINVVGCNGQTSLTYDGRTYDLVEIGGQCWFADNLATDQYRNGDAIPTGLDNATWSTTTNGAFAIYNNDPVNDSIYGKLYNWFTTVDSRGLCPTGWHVPSDCEWMYLEGSLGMSVENQVLTGNRGQSEGASLKATVLWNYGNTNANNSSGFSGLPGGYVTVLNGQESIGDYGFFWTSSFLNSDNSWYRRLTYGLSDIVRNSNSKKMGLSIRCLKDSETPFIQGCTDGAACNFLANANQDDGSCLYQNAICDDENANTINDVINGSCQCAGTVLAIGQDYQGGKIAYIFQPGENGYVSGEIHGMIVSNADVANTFRWACTVTDVPGASGNGVGAGLQNTMDIVNGVTACETAALAAYGFTLNGFNDWVLPSISELSVIYENRSFFGTFPNVWYWSSTEVNAYFAYRFGFSDSNTLQMGASTFGKESFCGVRPVRYF